MNRFLIAGLVAVVVAAVGAGAIAVAVRSHGAVLSLNRPRAPNHVLAPNLSKKYCLLLLTWLCACSIVHARGHSCDSVAWIANEYRCT